jgi:hypothetical protein
MLQGKGGNRVRKFANYFIVDEWAFQRASTISAKADFEYNLYATIVIEEG